MFDEFLTSPEEKLHFPEFDKAGIEVFLKRDDLIHPFISGNKWRKLKYNLREARHQQKNHIVTFGGAFSNHLLATACAAAKYGFKATGYVRGETTSNYMLNLCKWFGMNLHTCDRQAYTNRLAVFEKHHADDPNAWFMDEGGAGYLAVKGCAELADEIQVTYNHVICSVGTGTTFVGLAEGFHKKHPETTVHGVLVHKSETDIPALFHVLPNAQKNTMLWHDYHFGGFARTSPELLQFIQAFAAQTGILIDQVYEGKMMYAVFDKIRNGFFHAGDKILIIHSGGTFGLLSEMMPKKFVGD